MMKRILLLICLLLPASQLFAGSDMTLIYYFKNLTGDSAYDDLMYSIPVCLSSRLGEEYTLIDRSGLDMYLEDPSIDLWDRDYLMNSVGRKIKNILFGIFYLEGERVVLQGRMYYAESGLVLDVNEQNWADFDELRTVEDSADDIRGCTVGEDAQLYKPRARSAAGVVRPESNKLLVMNTGVFLPTGEWSEIYDTGVYGDYVFGVFPGRKRLRFGVGTHTGFILMNRSSDDRFVSSKMMIIPIGGGVHYALLNKAVDRVMLDFTLGMALSKLSVNYDTSYSTDLYTKGGVSVTFHVRQLHFSLVGGLMTVGYRDNPLNAAYAELGVRFYE